MSFCEQHTLPLIISSPINKHPKGSSEPPYHSPPPVPNHQPKISPVFIQASWSFIRGLFLIVIVTCQGIPSISKIHNIQYTLQFEVIQRLLQAHFFLQPLSSALKANTPHIYLAPSDGFDFSDRCVAAAGASGVGGGGCLVPMFIFLVGLSPQHAIPLSKASIFGNSVASYVCNYHRKHPFRSHAPLIDYNLALFIFLFRHVIVQKQWSNKFALLFGKFDYYWFAIPRPSNIVH